MTLKNSYPRILFGLDASGTDTITTVIVGWIQNPHTVDNPFLVWGK